MRNTIFPIASWNWSSVVHADPTFAAPWWDYVRFIMWVICGDAWSEGSAVSPEAEKAAVESYEAHCDGIRKLVADKERLLEWNPAEGWRPLCEFLHVQVPFVKEFPIVNDADEFVDFHKRWFEGLKKQAERRIIID
jgi:hypothetical protein